MSKKLLLRDAWSADIFENEVKTTMTELARILTECKDTVFTVNFKKKVNTTEVADKLGALNNGKNQS